MSNATTNGQTDTALMSQETLLPFLLNPQSYPHRPRAGLIGSGHRHVRQARLKLPGCAWLLSNAQSITQLRVLRSDDRWPEFWPLAA